VQQQPFVLIISRQKELRIRKKEGKEERKKETKKERKKERKKEVEERGNKKV
jgi:hypothetical protein